MKISNVEYLSDSRGYSLLSMEVEGVRVVLGVDQKDWLESGYVLLGQEFEAARPDLVSPYKNMRGFGFVKSDKLVKIYKDFYEAVTSCKFKVGPVEI